MSIWKNEEGRRLRRGWFFEEYQSVEAEEWLNDLGKQGWELEYIGFWNAVFKTSGSSVMQYACVKQALYRTYEAEDNAKETFEKAGWKYIDCHKNTFVFCAQAGMARPELPAGYVVPRPFLAKARPRTNVIAYFAVVALFILFFVADTVTGKLADILLHSEFWMLIVLCCCILCIAQFTVELQKTIRRRKAAEEPMENNDAKVPEYRKTYVRNRVNRVLGFVFAIVLALARGPFPSAATAQPVAAEHMVQISVPDIVKTTSDTATFEYVYDIGHSLLYPQQMEMRESEDDRIPRYNTALQLEEYRAQMPWLAVILADELARFGPANGNEHNQLRPSGNKMGFDRLWYCAADSGAILLAQKGKDVYLIKLDQPAPLGDMATALKVKITLAGGGK